MQQKVKFSQIEPKTIALYMLQFLFVFLLFFMPAVDTDLGWHLRYGEHFWKNGEVLRQNTLSYLLPDYQWSYSATFYQTLIYLIHAQYGLLGLSALYAGTLTLIYFFFARINQGLKLFSLIGFLFVSWVGWVVFYLGIRSQIMSLLGIVMTIFLLTRLKTSPKWLFAFPMLFLIWVNTHGGFIIGVLLMLFYLLQLLFDKQIKSAVFLSLSLLVSFGVTLLNPFGLEVYAESFRHVQYPLETLIAEWVPPTLLVQFSIGLISLFMFYLLWAYKTTDRVFWSLLVASFTYLAIDAKRNLPLWGLAISLIVLRIFAAKLKEFELKSYLQITMYSFLGISLTFLLLFTVPQSVEMAKSWESYCYMGNVVYPCKAIDYIKQHNISGQNVYTAYEWGGFLSWQMPQYKYFSDGRMPAWDTPEKESPYTLYLEIIQAQPGYQERLDKYGTDWLLIGSGTFLDIELEKNPEVQWKQVYKDEVATIYLKK